MRLRTLDLYCGAGAGAWGAQLAGAEIVCGVDAWKLALDTFSSNFPRSKALNLTLDGNSAEGSVGRIGPIELILASPECTNHTHAKGADRSNEASRETALHTIQFVRKFKPRWIVIENVIQMRAWHRYDELVNSLESKLGYNLAIYVLDSSEFGVAQTRRRMFIVGDRVQSPPEQRQFGGGSRLPASSILDEKGSWPSRPLYLKGRAEPTIERAERAISALGRKVPFLLVYYGSDASGGWQSLERPLRTITTVDRFGLVEWEGNTPLLRMLQVPELQRAMGLNDEYSLPHGTRRDRIKMLGNGICAPVMESVVGALTTGRESQFFGPFLEAAE